jgi:hypothetical protein
MVGSVTCRLNWCRFDYGEQLRYVNCLHDLSVIEPPVCVTALLASLRCFIAMGGMARIVLWVGGKDLLQMQRIVTGSAEPEGY